MSTHKQINLFRKKKFETSSTGKILQWALTYGRYIIISTEIIVLLAFVSRFKFDKDLTDLREEITQKTAIVEANQGRESEIRNIQNRIAQIKTLTFNQQKILTILNTLQKLTPTEVSFDTLTITQNSILLTAKTLSPQGFTDFVNNVRNSMFFDTVRVEKLEQEKERVVRFNLSAVVVFDQSIINK